MGNMKEKSIIFYRIIHELFYLAMNHHCDKKFVQIVAIIINVHVYPAFGDEILQFYLILYPSTSHSTCLK